MRVLDDGRELMASFDDIDNFFKKNKIIGRTIIDIKGKESVSSIHKKGKESSGHSSRVMCRMGIG